jgi:hypothetical protein
MRYLVPIFLLLSSCTYVGAETNVAWDRPTERVNGDALFVDELHHYEIVANCGETAYTYEAPGAAGGIIIDAIGNCAITVRVLDINNLASDWVVAIDVTIISPPRTISNLRILN